MSTKKPVIKDRRIEDQTRFRSNLRSLVRRALNDNLYFELNAPGYRLKVWDSVIKLSRMSIIKDERIVHHQFVLLDEYNNIHRTFPSAIADIEEKEENYPRKKTILIVKSIEVKVDSDVTDEQLDVLLQPLVRSFTKGEVKFSGKLSSTNGVNLFHDGYTLTSFFPKTGNLVIHNEDLPKLYRARDYFIDLKRKELEASLHTGGRRKATKSLSALDKYCTCVEEVASARRAVNPYAVCRWSVHGLPKRGKIDCKPEPHMVPLKKNTRRKSAVKK